jgi:hypothetical protein
MRGVIESVSKELLPDDKKANLESSVTVPMRVRRGLCAHLVRRKMIIEF